MRCSDRGGGGGRNKDCGFSRNLQNLIYSFLAFAIVATLAGLSIWFFSTHRLPQTMAPSATPSASPTTETPFPTTRSGERMCPSPDNRFQKVLEDFEDKKLFLIEMIRFDGNTDKYDDYFDELNDFAKIVFDMNDFNSGNGRYDRVVITLFNRGEDFRNFISDEGSVIRFRNGNLIQDELYMATLNEDIPKLYPELGVGPESNGVPYEPEAFQVLGLKFVMGGRRDVASFDRATAQLKANNYLFGQAWFDIQAICNDSGSQRYDQIRVESIQTFSDFGNVINQPVWLDASRDREDGLERPASYSDIMEGDIYSNMYENFFP